MRSLPIEPTGLRIVLGGGLPVLARGPDLEESATILIRGGPGVGKTVLATHVASSVAGILDCDVAFGCIELLPSELAAQHESFQRPVVERVISAPFESFERRKGEHLFFAASLAREEVGENDLIPAIEQLLEVVTARGGNPRVLVLDSLLAGAATPFPRALADELSKMANVRGLVLILIEESAHDETSALCFVMDVVLELGARGWNSERSLVARKNRLGPCEPGPHTLLLQRTLGVQIVPSFTTYLRSWMLDELRPTSRQLRSRAQDSLLALDSDQRLVVVRGNVRREVILAAIGLALSIGPRLLVADLREEFSRRSFDNVIHLGGVRWRGDLGELLYQISSEVLRCKDKGGSVDALIVGDFGDVVNPSSADLQARNGFVEFCRRIELMVVFVDTSGSPSAFEGDADATLVVQPNGTATWILRRKREPVEIPSVELQAMRARASEIVVIGNIFR